MNKYANILDETETPAERLAFQLVKKVRTDFFDKLRQNRKIKTVFYFAILVAAAGD